MTILGIHGHARSGKDTLGQYLINIFKEEYNRHFMRVAFADELKKMCAQHFDLSYEQLWGDKKEEPDFRYVKELPGEGTVLPDEFFWTPREIMQEFGGFYRKIDRNFWVNILDKYVGNGKDVIVTDVRYLNEVGYIEENGGVNIRVVRDVDNKIHGQNHASETELDNCAFDITVENNSTLEGLMSAAYNIANAILHIDKLSKKGRII